MARFGWAYVDCTESGAGGQAAGPTGSLQFLTGANATSGSARLIFNTSSYSLFLTGTLHVSGAISASSYHIKDITEIHGTGSTTFGDSNDDVHIRTGSLYVGPSGGPAALQVRAGDSSTHLYSLNVQHRAITAETASLASTDYIISVDGTSNANQEIQLLSASACGAGRLLIIKDISTSRSGRITVSASVPAGGFSIDGASHYVLTGTMPAINLYSNGTNWFVF